MNFWVKVLLVNWAINIGCVEFLCLRKMKPITNVNEKRDSKYPAFRRKDVWWFSRRWLYPLCHLFLVKIISIFAFDFLIVVLIRLLAIGTDKNKPFTGWRRWILNWLTTMVCFQILFLNGIYYINRTRPEVCYKKFLGPDWKADYDSHRTGTLVANHSSIYDALVHSLYQMPCFIAKAEVANFPMIGTMATVSGTMYIRRDAKNQIQDTIIERQKLAEQDPNIDPLVIHAEGGTTNNTCVIKFKRGAFVGLRSIWPKAMKYNAPFWTPSSGVIDGLPHYVAGGANPYSTLTMTELPVFRPNEYFFANHKQEGEEKWQTYERVIRTLIAEHAGLPLSDESIEDKFEYKKELFPGKYDKKKN